MLVTYLYQQILTISGLPSTQKGSRSTSDTGATYTVGADYGQGLISLPKIDFTKYTMVTFNWSTSEWLFFGWRERGASLHCSVQAYCGGLSCSAWALEQAGFGSCRMQAQQLQLPGSRTQAQ